MRGLTKTILVGLSIGAIAGFGYAAYKIFKGRKQEQILTMSDIDDILKTMKAKKEEDTSEDCAEEGEWGVDYGSEIESQIVTTMEEEEGEKHMKKGTDPNSQQAFLQYINMLFADLTPNSRERQMMERLLDFKFEPTTLGDGALYQSISDDRARFFGEESIYSTRVSWADVIMHYVNKVHYNLGDNVEPFTSYILTHLDIYPAMRNEDVENVLADVAYHTFTNNRTGLFGLFGLDDSGFEALQEQLEVSVEGKFTFEGEFNAFLGMATGEDK